jgi:hypothetical protein
VLVKDNNVYRCYNKQNCVRNWNRLRGFLLPFMRNELDASKFSNKQQTMKTTRNKKKENKKITQQHIVHIKELNMTVFTRINESAEQTKQRYLEKTTFLKLK